jgi:GTP 3',8-cyclase
MEKYIDKFNRNLSYLRISITDRCNLRCRYCVPLTPVTMLSHKDILHYEEILRIVKVGVEHGIKKVRITGGEPLVRKGVYDFLASLKEVEGIEDISLTTNGILLRDNIDRIKDAGVKRINISLDSLNRENFSKITRRDHFDKVWQGIQLAIEKGFDPVKINVVVMKGVNDHEILDLAGLAIHYPLHVRFIEYMPIGEAHVDKTQQLLTPETKEIVSSLGELVPVKNGENDGPAFRYRFKKGQGEVGFISPISHHFCSKCNRLRLTANGMLRSCLLSDDQVDLKTHIRNGCSDEKISELYLESINHKQRKHHLDFVKDQKISTQMSAIGG